MTEREKIDAALAHLKGLRVPAGTAAPPFWRLCWRAGVLIPPPHFLGPVPLLMFAGLPFGIVLNVSVIVFLLVVERSLEWPVAAVGLSGAILFGSALAGYYRWSARRLGLPAWSEFCADVDTLDSDW